MRYRDGIYEFDRNLPEGVRYIRMAAERGFAKAQSDLGYMYAMGLGVPQDKKKSFDLNMQAAVQGNAIAQHNVGNKYYKGEGVDKDVKQSFIWFKKAADQGIADAQCKLGKSVYVFIIDVQYVHTYIYNNRMCIPLW